MLWSPETFHGFLKAKFVFQTYLIKCWNIALKYFQLQLKNTWYQYQPRKPP